MHTLGTWFFVAMGAILAGQAAWELGHGLLALSWPTTSGRVLEIGVQHHEVGFRGGYAPTVRYAYEVGGRRFEGTRLGFGRQALRGSEEKARRSLGALVTGTEVAVYYSPRRPGDAALRRGVTLVTLWPLLVGVFMVTIGLRL